MNEYTEKVQLVNRWAESREWSAIDLHMLYSRVFNVIHYRRLWRDADKVDVQLAAAHSRDDAIEDLVLFMRARCVPSKIRLAIHWLSSHTP